MRRGRGRSFGFSRYYAVEPRLKLAVNALVLLALSSVLVRSANHFANPGSGMRQLLLMGFAALLGLFSAVTLFYFVRAYRKLHGRQDHG